MTGLVLLAVNQYCAHSFADNCPSWISGRLREWPEKIFHDQSPRKNVADLGGGWTRDLLVSSRTAHPIAPRPGDDYRGTWPMAAVAQQLRVDSDSKPRKDPCPLLPRPSSATEGASTPDVRVPCPDKACKTACEMIEAKSGLLHEGLGPHS